MPPCVACGRDLPRAAFSTTQLKKKEASSRRCKECVSFQFILPATENVNAQDNITSKKIPAAFLEWNELYLGNRATAHQDFDVYDGNDIFIEDNSSSNNNNGSALFVDLFPLCYLTENEEEAGIDDDGYKIENYDAASVIFPMLQSIAPLLKRAKKPILSDNGDAMAKLRDLIQLHHGKIPLVDFANCLPKHLKGPEGNRPEGDLRSCIVLWFNCFEYDHAADLEKLDLCDNNSKEKANSECCCPICFGDIGDIEEKSNWLPTSDLYCLPCAHAFHRTCFEDWRRKSHPNAGKACPICGDPLPEKVIRRKIVIPEQNLMGKLAFQQNLHGNQSSSCTWMLQIPKGFQVGDILEAKLDCGGHLVLPEPSSKSLETAIMEKLAQQKRGIIKKDDRYSFRFQCSPRCFAKMHKSTCSDCGCVNSYCRINLDYENHIYVAQKQQTSFENLWEDSFSREGDVCFGCNRGCPSIPWRFSATKQAWYRKSESDTGTSDHQTRIVLATVPPVLCIPVERNEIRDNSIFFSYAEISMPLQFDISDYISSELKEAQKESICTIYNLRLFAEIHPCQRNANDFMEKAGIITGMPPESRYRSYFKSLLDNKWYMYDVCMGKPSPLPEMEEGARFSSRCVVALVFVRKDLDF